MENVIRNCWWERNEEEIRALAERNVRLRQIREKLVNKRKIRFRNMD